MPAQLEVPRRSLRVCTGSPEPRLSAAASGLDITAAAQHSGQLTTSRSPGSFDNWCWGLRSVDAAVAPRVRRGRRAGRWLPGPSRLFWRFPSFFLSFWVPVPTVRHVVQLRLQLLLNPPSLSYSSELTNLQVENNATASCRPSRGLHFWQSVASLSELC